jgi:hypothetical protein
MTEASMAISGTDHGAPAPRVPTAAAWLGGLGLIPFIALSLASGLAPGSLKMAALQGLLGYGAVILSFLGGVHWGAELVRSQARADHGIDARRLAISVIPSLVGWAALLLEPRLGLLLLAAGFAAQLLVDLRATRQGLAPLWYPKLRKLLTTIVMAALIAALLGQ